MSRSITSVKTFVEYIMKLREDSLSKGLSSYQWFFRGQENSKWSVYPNVFRNDGVAKEHQIIQSALRQNPFEFQNKNDFEILTKLQHYGLGTRLVDVTLNPLVALYFASAESIEYKENKNSQFSKEEKDGSVFVKYAPWHATNELCIRIASAIPFLEIDHSWTTTTLISELRKARVVSEDEQATLERDDCKLLIEYLQSSYFVVSSHSNERLIRQSGAFIIPTFINFSDNTNIKLSLISKSFDSINEMFSDEVITIPAKNKKAIREELDFFNINEATLFPELEHQMTYIKQRNVIDVGTVPSFVRYRNIAQSEDNDCDFNDKMPNVERIVNAVAGTLSKDTLNTLVSNIKDLTSYVDWKQKDVVRSQIKTTCRRILQEELSSNDSMQMAQLILDNLLSPTDEFSIIELEV